MRDQYLPGNRFVKPEANKQIDSMYDVHSPTLQDMVQRTVRPFIIYTLNLGAASSNNAVTTPPTQGDWIEYKTPGNHITMYGYDSATVNQANITGAFCEVYVGSQQPSPSDEGYPLKHNRVLSGPFDRFFVRWPTQATANIKAKLVVSSYAGSLPINGEAST